jgi:hypothetical protein
MVSLISLADRVISLGSKVRPVWLRKRLFSLLFLLYAYVSRLKAVVFQFRLPVYVVSGVEKTSGEKIRFLFVGRETFPLFLIELLFTSAPHVEQVGMVFVWRLHKLDCFFSSDVDAVLVSCDRFYQRWPEKAGLFVFPHMVDMVLDVSDPFDVFYKGLSNSAKADIKKVEKYKYTFEVFSDINQLRFFYDSMYRPLIETRYADAPVYTPPFTFFKLLHMIGYQLLLVKDEKGDFVSGIYFHVKRNEVFCRYLGVINGELELIRKGAESALYCFLMDYAKDQKVNVLDFGGARPFFNDGLFLYKRKWGMKVVPSDFVKEIFGLRMVNESEQLKQFLIQNPFIGINEKNELIGYVFVDKKTFRDAMSAQFEKRFQTPGVNEVRFIKLDRY